MKKIQKNIILIVLITLTIASCEKTNNDSESNDIVYKSVNKEYVVIRDVQELQESDDEISNHIDSILNGLIDAEFVSTGIKNFDLDGDSVNDIGFEIIDLIELNPNGLPESFDSLAARVVPITVQILDNSTYGYPDALDPEEEISKEGNWINSTAVLGTFENAGQFQGEGEKYLGIRLQRENNYKYGWIKIYCSQHSDTLRIIDFAYHNIPNNRIKAGQKE